MYVNVHTYIHTCILSHIHTFMIVYIHANIHTHIYRDLAAVERGQVSTQDVSHIAEANQRVERLMTVRDHISVGRLSVRVCMLVYDVYMHMCVCIYIYIYI